MLPFFLCFFFITSFSERPTKPLTEDEAKVWSYELIETFMTHPIYDHPLMRKLGLAEYPDHEFAVKFYTQQMYCDAQNFRAYLGLTIAKMRCCDEVRNNLIDHLREENGFMDEKELAEAGEFGINVDLLRGTPHIDLLGIFLDHYGLTKTWLPSAMVFNQWQLDTITQQSATVGVLLLLANELWSGTIGVEFIPGLRKAGVPKDVGIWFDLHSLVDTEIHIGDLVEDLISMLTEQVPENSLDELKRWMTEFNDVRLKFFNEQHEVMSSRPAAELPEPGDGPLCYGETSCRALEESSSNSSYDHSEKFHQRILEHVFKGSSPSS